LDGADLCLFPGTRPAFVSRDRQVTKLSVRVFQVTFEIIRPATTTHTYSFM
jgi:hypothetical protein